MNYENWNIAGYDLEFLEDSHTYLVDGVILPSITQMLKFKFNNKYQFVDSQTLKRAAMKGTETHRAIEEYCKDKTESDLPELRNFKFLQKQYGFEVLGNELPVLLFDDYRPIASGRLDLVLEMDGKIGLADIKRTATLDKEYLGYQLNLYRLAYMQSYGVKAEFLKGIHLRDNVRKFVNIPINEEATWKLVNDYFGVKNE